MAVTLSPSPLFSKSVSSPPVAVCNTLKLEASVIVTVFPATAPVLISTTRSAVVKLTSTPPLLAPSFGVIVPVISVAVPVNAAKIVFVGLAAAGLTTVLNVFVFLVLPLATDVSVMEDVTAKFAVAAVSSLALIQFDPIPSRVMSS